MSSTELIANSLEELEHCPSDAVREMLLHGLPFAFGSGERHSYQVEYAKLLRKCLEGERELRLEMQQKSTVEAGEVKSQLDESQTGLTAATETVQAAKSVVADNLTTLNMKQEASKEEEKSYLEAKAEKDAALVERQKLEQEKAEVDSVANGSLQMLLNGSWEDKDACDDFVSAVSEYLKGMKCEAPLLAALPRALAQRPAERRLFDEVVFEEVVRIIGAKVTTVTSKIETEEEKFEDVRATELGAWAIWDVACDEAGAAEKSHEQAQEELAAANNQQVSLEAQIAERTSLLEKASLEQVLAESKAEEIQRTLVELDRLENSNVEECIQDNAETSESSPKRRKLEEADIDIHVSSEILSVAA